MKRQTEKIVQEERAEHRKYQEKFLLLLKKNLELWEEKKSLSNEIKNLCKKIDNLQKDFNKITQQIFTGKKVREYSLPMLAEKVFLCCSRGIWI